MEVRNNRREKVTATYLHTVREQCENWIDPDNEYKPRKADQVRIDRIGFKGGIGSVKLSDLRASNVVAFRDAMRAHGACVVTTRRVIGTLSRILKHAAERDMIAANVAKGIRGTGKRD